MKKVVLSVVIPLGLSVSVGWTGQPNPTPFVPPTRCQPPAAINKSAIGLPEARGSATNVEVWALFFHPLTANRRVKICGLT